MKYVTWTRNGKEYTQVSPAYKYELLQQVAKEIGAKTFVETGTDSGTTVEIFRHLTPNVYSIDIDETNYMNAWRRFYDCVGVCILHGDSGVVLPMLLPMLEGPVLFWLDAHDADYNGPVKKELAAILASGIKGVVLIDDMDYLPNPPWHQRMEVTDGIAKITLTGEKG